MGSEDRYIPWFRFREDLSDEEIRSAIAPLGFEIVEIRRSHHIVFVDAGQNRETEMAILEALNSKVKNGDQEILCEPA